MNKEDVNEMLKTFPIGIKILFKHELENWQNSLHHSTIMKPNEHTITSVIATYSEPKEPATQPLQVPTTSVTIDLGEMLNATTTGKMIIDYYKEHKKLNSNIRSLLVDTIISYVITKNMCMSVYLAETISNHIITMFPSEVKVRYMFLFI